MPAAPDRTARAQAQAIERQWYEAAAGMLRRIVPAAPPYPVKRRPFRGEAAGASEEYQAQGDGTVPGEPPDDDGPGDGIPPDQNDHLPFDEEPPDGPGDGIPSDQNDPIPPDDDPPDMPGAPSDPNTFDHVVVSDELFGGIYPGDPDDAGAPISRPDQSTFTDTFDSVYAISEPPGAWWTPLRGTWRQANGVLGITVIEAANVPRAVLLYNPWTYTDGHIDITLDNVTAGAVKYAIMRGADNGAGLLNGYAFRLTGSGAVNSGAIVRMDNGVATVLGALLTQAFVAGDTFGLEITGTTLQARRNGVVFGTTRTDATYAAGLSGIGGDSTVPAYRAASLAP